MNKPTSRLPKKDTGAETQRNFKYQSVYGVVLLCSAIGGKSDYRAVWCEQEDDLLAEISDSQFDSYQVKTRTPELGYWDCSFKGFVSAVAVFLSIERRFANSIRYYNFICEALPFKTEETKKKYRCPMCSFSDFWTKC
jgi:hypothetical protein